MLCDYDFNLRKKGDKITTSVAAAAAAVPKNGYRVESKVYIVYLRLLRVMLETAGNVVQYKPYLY
jgi:DNA-binding winged helix-turn-helix (wHTH) protein